MQQVCKFGRNPFLHLIVLMANQYRNCTKYAHTLENYFYLNGIDVFLQSQIFPAQNGSSVSVAKGQDIRAEHLAELVCNSNADFLIVVGDRNVKNKTCHAKRKGKLVEMQMQEVNMLIWKAWPQNKAKTEQRIESFSEAQTETLIFQHGGPSDVFLRFRKFQALAEQLNTDKSYRTLFEEGAIRLHRQLINCMIKLRNIAVKKEEHCVGEPKTIEYKPNAQRTPKNSICEALKTFLIKVVKSLTEKVETIITTMLSRGFLLPAYTEWLSTTEGDVILSSESSNESLSLSEGSELSTVEATKPHYDAKWSEESAEGDTSTESVRPHAEDTEISQMQSGFGEKFSSESSSPPSDQFKMSEPSVGSKPNCQFLRSNILYSPPTPIPSNYPVPTPVSPSASTLSNIIGLPPPTRAPRATVFQAANEAATQFIMSGGAKSREGPSPPSALPAHLDAVRAQMMPRAEADAVHQQQCQLRRFCPASESRASDCERVGA